MNETTERTSERARERTNEEEEEDGEEQAGGGGRSLAISADPVYGVSKRVRSLRAPPVVLPGGCET